MSDRSIRAVLACVDFSPCSRPALEQARRRAEAERAELHVVHVVEAPVVDELARALGADAGVLRQELVSSGEDRLREFCGDARLHVVAGALPMAVLETAASVKAGLLVLGVRGESNGEGPGSLAMACARRSRVPVLLVREGHDGPYRSIVAGVDFSEVSRRAAAEAVQVARTDGARLAVVHGFFPPWERLHYRAPTPAASPHFQRQYRDSLEDRLRGFVAELAAGAGGAGIEHELYETANHGLGLIECARRREADLVVLGTLGRGNLLAMMLGNTAERILHAAATSVLVVPPRAEP